MRTFQRLFATAMLVAFFGTFQVFARPPQTTLSDDQEKLQDAPIVMTLPITAGKKGSLLGFLGKMANVPKMTEIKEVGFLFNAMDVQAFQAQPDNPGSFHSKTVLKYLLGSKEMMDSLKLRRTARQIKFQLIRKSLDAEKDVPADVKKAVLDYLSQQVGAPMVILAQSPLPKFLPEPGPCMIPLGIERIDPKSGKRLGLETSAICAVDIKSGNETLFSIKEALTNDTLDLVICHENAHAIMFDMYGKVFKDIQRTSTNGHDAPYITDQGLAYIEGWAEAFEAFYGPANLKFKEKDRKKYNISEFLFGRQDPIRRDRYVWARPTGKKTGVPKNGCQLMATEGVIAGQFYDILSSRKITAPFEKCVTVMLLKQPQNYQDFFRTFVEMFKEDRAVMTRILLENLKYVTMDPKAAEQYRQYYTCNVAHKQKTLAKPEFLKVRNAWLTFKDGLFKKALGGADVFANVGPQLWFSAKIKIPKEHGWFDVKYKLMKKLGLESEIMELRLDLNTVTAKALKFLGIEEEVAEKLIEDRNKAGFFKGNPLETLKKYMGEEKFSELKAKAQIELYKLNIGNETSAEQMAVIWPEDLERIPESD